MQNMQRRLHRLERLPQMKPPPTRLEQIRALAYGRLSNEELATLRILTVDLNAGLNRVKSETELEALATLGRAFDEEAQRMGFKSYAQAERRGGRR